MDKLSGTWEGMWSNLQDNIAQFALEIGRAGVFDALKAELRGVLDTLERMSKDGSLKRYAKDISDGMLSMFKAFKQLFGELKKANWAEIAFWMKVVFGVAIAAQIAAIGSALIGFAVALGGVAKALGAMKLVTGLVGLFQGLSAAFAFCGIALAPLLIAVGLLVAAGYLLWKNWQDVVGGAKALWEDLSAVVGMAVDKMLEKIQPLLDMGARIKGALGSFFGGGFGGVSVLGARGVNGAPAAAGGGGAAAALKAQQQQVAGEMTVRFENAPAGMRAEPGKTSAPGFSLNPAVGYRSAAWGNS